MTYLSGLETYKPPLTRGGNPFLPVKRTMPVLRPSVSFFNRRAVARRAIISPAVLYGDQGLSGLFSFIGKAAKKVGKAVGGAAKGVFKKVIKPVAKGVGKVAKPVVKVVGKVARPVLKVGAGVAGLALPGIFGKVAQTAGGLIESGGGGGGGGGSAYGGGDDSTGTEVAPVAQASMFGGINPMLLIGGAAVALILATRRSRG